MIDRVVRTLRLCAVAGLGFAALIGPGTAVAEDVPFSSPRWTITRGRVGPFLGIESLAGSAALRDATFRNGVIEVDVAVDGQRAFPGVEFRARDAENLELVYLRPHKPKAADTLQYTPVENSLGSWQLYSGRGFTAPADVPTGRWVHLRIEVAGSRARVFWDGGTTPALAINDLRFGDGTGYLGLRAPANGSVHFANFRYAAAESLDLGPTVVRSRPTGMLAAWQLSRPFPAREVSRVVPPSAQSLGDLGWRDVSADPQGLVDIARHVRKTGTSTESVFARTTIEAAADGVRKLTFGYSDEVTVFLNGAPLFSGDSRFTVRDPEFNGIVGLNDAVYLPLKKGANELVLLVTETFGGWGFMARLEDVKRLAVVLATGASRAWQADGLKMPESVAFDPKRNVFYASNYGSGGTPEKRTGTVARLALDGTVREADWVSGLAAPLGLAVLDDTLYVVEDGGVALVDLNAGSVSGHVACPGGLMLNDLDVAPNGDAYVSDSQAGVIYRVRGGTCAPWHSGWPLARPNGVRIDGDRLVVGDMADATLYLFRLADAALDAIVEMPLGTVDGVERDGRGSWIVTLYEGQIVRVAPDGAYEVLVDTTAAGIGCADFEFVPELGLAVVPTFTGNGVIAFRVGAVPR
jgi:hypothetical protein